MLCWWTSIITLNSNHNAQRGREFCKAEGATGGVGLLRTAFDWRALCKKKKKGIRKPLCIYEVDQNLEVTNLLTSMSLQLKTGIVSRQFWITLTRCILNLKQVCILSLCLKHQWVKAALHFEKFYLYLLAESTNVSLGEIWYWLVALKC